MAVKKDYKISRVGMVITRKILNLSKLFGQTIPYYSYYAPLFNLFFFNLLKLLFNFNLEV